MGAGNFFIMLVFVLILSFSLQEKQEKDSRNVLERLIEKQVEKFPELEVQDLYKFLHQAAMGSEHAVKDSASTAKWMEDEIAGLDMNKDDALIDTLSPDGRIVRVNLRPFLKEGYNPNQLLKSFSRKAERIFEYCFGNDKQG
jgi:hypothetical protein